MNASSPAAWPDLDLGSWRDTRATLHLWTQVVGKIRLSRTPWLNHSWHVPLYVTSRGLTTSPIPHDARTFEIEFDFREHRLRIEVSDGQERQLPLVPRSVAQFFRSVMSTLDDLGLSIEITTFPCEIPDAIAFERDTIHSAYDPAWAHAFWQALLRIDGVFKAFRTQFLGKASPVHFFWGSFDLAVTRFSGRRAPAFQGNVPGLATSVMREAYSHEVSSAGFWPGSGGVDEPNFYSYAYPVPEQFRHRPVAPPEAHFSEALGEFLLSYDAVRKSRDPEATLMAFLESTYAAAADTANWDRGALDCPTGIPCAPPDR
jgi:Family of unknown function (DUF5996)